MKKVFYLSIAVILLSLLAGCVNLWENDTIVDVSPEVRSVALDATAKLTTAKTTSSFNRVTLLLPLQGKLASVGQAVRDGFLTAYNNASISARPAHVDIIDTTRMGSIEAAYQKAVEQGADFIVGPLAKEDVQALNLFDNLSVPVLALNYLDASQATSAQLYQFGLSPLDEARQVAILAQQNDYHRALIIVPAGNWGQSVAHVFQSEWQAAGGEVAGSLFFTGPNQTLSTQIRRLLHFNQTDKQTTPTRRNDFDMIFLAASPETARQIKPLLKFYYAEDVPVYAVSLVYSGVSHPQWDNDLNGITFCDAPWVLNAQQSLTSLRQRIALFWPANFQQNARLYALGVDAYQLVTHFSLLTSFTEQNVQGATGMLRFDSQQRVVRQLTCAQFRDGVPRVLGLDNG